MARGVRVPQHPAQLLRGERPPQRPARRTAPAQRLGEGQLRQRGRGERPFGLGPSVLGRDAGLRDVPHGGVLGTTDLELALLQVLVVGRARAGTEEAVLVPRLQQGAAREPADGPFLVGGDPQPVEQHVEL